MEKNIDEDVDEGCICQRWPMLVLALSFFVFGVVGILVSYAMLHDASLEHKHHYGVVIDAGSTHTDITIYNWPSDVKYQGTAHVKQIGFSTCLDEGLSTLSGNPSKVKEIIENCIEDVALKKVPKHSRHHTPVYVGATAGMRLICARNETSCSRILQSISEALKKYKFEHINGSVKVLSGKEEGTFGWVSVNILKKRIAEKQKSRVRSTFGALDMGGASAEISFIPKAEARLPDDYKSELRLYGKNYTLYTHSFLCYGMKEAERRLLASLVQDAGYAFQVKNPCYPIGYERNNTAKELWLQPCSMKPKGSIFPVNESTNYVFAGSSDPKECTKAVKKLFNETTCNFGSCSFDGVYQPEVTGRFVAFSGYGFLADFFNLTEDDSIEIMAKSGKTFCQKTWTKLKEEYHSTPLKFLSKNCFNAIYTHQILTYGFHFENNSKQIQFSRKVRGHDIGWSLGLMVNASNLIPIEEPRSRISRQDFIFFTSLSMVVMAFGIMLCFCYSIKNCRSQSNLYQKLPYE